MNEDQIEHLISWFRSIDPYGFDEIPWPYFRQQLYKLDINCLSRSKVNLLLYYCSQHIGDNNPSSNITLDFFIGVVTGKRSRSFNCAVHHRDRCFSSLNDFHIITFDLESEKNVSMFRKMRMKTSRWLATQYLTDERDRKFYADHYRCVPPPLFIISITLIELVSFIYYNNASDQRQKIDNSLFIYRPDRRHEIWRFLLYMILHAGWIHLMFNLLVQLLVGLPLEMVHGSFRILIIYMSGVLAGSLGTSIFDPDVYLVGASGGVYALLAAHLANVLINYHHMEFGFLRVIGVIAIASVDVGFAVYDRYNAAAMSFLNATSVTPRGTDDLFAVTSHPVSYVAHLTGGLSGLTIGLIVLKNFEQKLCEQLMWWVAVGVYGTWTIFAILYNILFQYHSSPFVVVHSN